MTNASRVTIIRLLAVVVLVPATASWAQQRPPIIEQVAKTYGLDSFGQIDAIRYTWNAQFPGVNVSRSWVWEPKTNKVSYEGRIKTVSRSRLPTCAPSLAANPTRKKRS